MMIDLTAYTDMSIDDILDDTVSTILEILLLE